MATNNDPPSANELPNEISEIIETGLEAMGVPIIMPTVLPRTIGGRGNSRLRARFQRRFQRQPVRVYRRPQEAAPAQEQQHTLHLPRCSYGCCDSVPSLGTRLKACSGCEQASYCSKTCQKRHWKQIHKYLCTNAKRHRLEINETNATNQDEEEEEEKKEPTDNPNDKAKRLQDAIDAAESGDVIEIPSGIYQQTAIKIHNKSLFLFGDGLETTVLQCHVIACGDSSTHTQLTISNLSVHGRIQVDRLHQVHLISTRVHCPDFVRFNAVIVRNVTDCLVYNCEIIGGSDAVCSLHTSLHLRQCDIHNAQHCGVVSNSTSTLKIEDCNIYGCQAVKSAAGYEEEGLNELTEY